MPGDQTQKDHHEDQRSLQRLEDQPALADDPLQDVQHIGADCELSTLERVQEALTLAVAVRIITFSAVPASLAIKRADCIGLAILFCASDR